MQRLATACLVFLSLAVPAQAKIGCAAFTRTLGALAPGHPVAFSRPLTVSRFMRQITGTELTTLVTDAEIDGTLQCRGDVLQRFELRIPTPANARLVSTFETFEAASLAAALGYDRAKANVTLRGLSSDAAEYLRASNEREDTSIAGKVELHQGGDVSLGMIWTNTDRTFVIVGEPEG